MASGKKVAVLSSGPDGSVWDLSFSPDGETIASAGGGNGAVRLWDVATRKEKAALKFLPNGDCAFSLAFSPDGKTLVSNGRGVIVFWDVATGKKTSVIDTFTQGPHALAFSPDGKTLASAGGAEGKVKVNLWGRCHRQKDRVAGKGMVIFAALAS